MKRTNIKNMLLACKGQAIYQHGNTLHIGNNAMERYYINATLKTVLIGCLTFALTLSVTLNILSHF